MREMKDSGIAWIGEIPDDWRIIRNKNAFTCSKELVGEKSELTQLLSLTTRGIKKKDINNAEGKLPESFDTYQFVKENDLVMCLFDLDCSAVFSGISPYNGMISPAYRVLSCKKCMEPKYADYWFQYISDGRKFNHYAKNIRYTLSYEEFSALPLLLPERNEQRRIADYLDRKCSQIDAIIARQQEVIEKLKAYKLSVITEAVTKGLNPDVPMKDSGVEWIGKIPEHWAIHKFCWDYSAMLGKMLDAKRITGEHLHPYIKNADVQWDSINFEDLDEMDFSDEEKERYTISPGDLMVCEGGEIGKCAIVPDDIPEDIYYQKALHRVRKRHPDSGNIHFLCKVIYCMAKNNCLNTSPEKATIAHLPGDALSQLRIPTPPISEQGQIAEYLNDKCMEIDRFSARKHETIDKLIEYKKSLIYEVVTGKKEV
jgi:type I restriction enzyme S subunit